MSFYIWKDIDALDYVSRIQNQYPSLKGTPAADLLKKWDFYRLPGGSTGYFHDYLHPPVTGYEVLVVPQTPSVPNQPLLPEIPNGSYLTDNVQPAIKITEIGSEVAVTGGGVMSAVSSATATAAVGAAIGFGVGVNWFETYPEKWTEISNTVFGTDLDPSEIGQITRDTNALVMIKDGVSYMCAPMIDAIRDKLNDLGFYQKEIVTPTYEGATVTATISKHNGITPQQLITMSGRSVEDIRSVISDPNNLLDDFLTNEDDAVYTYGQNHYTSRRDGIDYPYNEYTWRKVKTTHDVPYDTTLQKVTEYPNGSLYTAPTAYAERQAISLFVRETFNNPSVLESGSAGLVSNNGYLVGGGYTKDEPTLFDNWRYGLSSVDAREKTAYPLYSPDYNTGDLSVGVKDAFPAWWNNGVDVISGIDDDGKPIYTRWLPVTLPSNKPITDGITYDQNKAQEGALPKDDSQVAEQIKTGTKDLTDTYPQVSTPTIPPTSTPTPTPPSIAGGGGSSTGLANLYNPTLAQVKEFSRWLWGSDGLNLDQLKKLLQDPMQAIIGLHVMYATPTTGADRTIQVGYINSGVSSKIVTEQYTEIDCGTVTINEYFGDARDYSPFTQIYCYLPFIGIVELNADDVVNSTLGIKYKIDVLTGCCLAQLTVKKYGLDAVLYTYTGNCAVQMPITSGNYLSTISSLLGTLASGAAAVATGGALAPVAIGAAASSLGGGARASVAMSGSLGSNAGAMGIRKPYLIIKRVESADANGYNEFYGYPANKRVNLSQLSGYVRVKDINLSGTNATEDEQNEIVTLLKEGVIL